MSRIGKQPIIIPEKTEVTQTGSVVSVKGPLGEISRSFLPDVKISVLEKEIVVSQTVQNKFTKALWGTYASHLRNMVDGVNKFFEKKLIIEGVGFKVEHSGSKLVLSLGFSHKVNVEIPKGINVLVEKNKITISGVNKEDVSSFAANIRGLKKPEPYKGKGIRYDDEIVKRKQGKKSA